MGGWDIFTDIASHIDDPMRAQIDAMMSGLFPGVRQGFLIGATIWLALAGYRVARGSNAPLQDMVTSLFYMAAVGATVSLSVYQSYVRDVALSLPDAINAALGGSGGFNANVFNEIFGRAWAGGLRVWQQASFTDFGIQVCVILFWLIAAVTTAAGFAIWLVARIMLYLAIGVGPLFFVLYLFNATRGYCQRWIGVVVGAITCQVLVAALLTIALGAEAALLTSLTANMSGALAGLRMLIAAGLLLIVVALILREIPAVATALAGGVHWHAGQLTHATMGRARSYAQAAIGHVASGGQRLVNDARLSVRQSPVETPGQSLSSILPPSRPAPTMIPRKTP